MRREHAQHARAARKRTTADHQEARGPCPRAFPAKRRTPRSLARGIVGRSAYPDKGRVGAAAHRSGGQARFFLSATAAAAALYGAVVVFGLGPSSPTALGESNARPDQTVRVHVSGPPAPRPALRGPQPSAGPARRHPRAQAARPGATTLPGVRTSRSEASPRGTQPAQTQQPHTDSAAAVAPSTAGPASAPPPVTTPVDTVVSGLPAVDVPVAPPALPPTPPLPVSLP